MLFDHDVCSGEGGRVYRGFRIYGRLPTVGEQTPAKMIVAVQSDT